MFPDQDASTFASGGIMIGYGNFPFNRQFWHCLSQKHKQKKILSNQNKMSIQNENNNCTQFARTKTYRLKYSENKIRCENYNNQT